jgi:uncharacterized membrane protein YccC
VIVVAAGLGVAVILLAWALWDSRRWTRDLARILEEQEEEAAIELEKTYGNVYVLPSSRGWGSAQSKRR